MLEMLLLVEMKITILLLMLRSVQVNMADITADCNSQMTKTKALFQQQIHVEVSNVISEIQYISCDLTSRNGEIYR